MEGFVENGRTRRFAFLGMIFAVLATGGAVLALTFSAMNWREDVRLRPVQEQSFKDVAELKNKAQKLPAFEDQLQATVVQGAKLRQDVDALQIQVRKLASDVIFITGKPHADVKKP